MLLRMALRVVLISPLPIAHPANFSDASSGCFSCPKFRCCFGGIGFTQPSSDLQPDVEEPLPCFLGNGLSIAPPPDYFPPSGQNSPPFVDCLFTSLSPIMEWTQQQRESQQMRPIITTNSVDARICPGRYPKHAFPIAFFPAPIGTVATPHFIQENANNATKCLSRCAGEFESVKNRCQQTTQLCPPRLTSKFSPS